MSLPVKLVTICDGRQYIYITTKGGGWDGQDTSRAIVHTKGEVLAISGASLRYGPDKRWQASRVQITDEPVELTEELIGELITQGLFQGRVEQAVAEATP